MQKTVHVLYKLIDCIEITYKVLKSHSMKPSIGQHNVAKVIYILRSLELA